MSGHRGHFLDTIVEKVYGTGNVFFISKGKDNVEKTGKLSAEIDFFKLMTGKYVELNNKNTNHRHSFGRFKTLMRS